MLNFISDYYYYYDTISDEMVGNDYFLFPPNRKYSFIYDFFTAYKLVIKIENSVTYVFKQVIM